jgi:hypothetical protein
VEGIPQPICAVSNDINIVAGPPKNITIFPNEVGEDGGGDVWELDVSALVVDTFNNPVRCGTAVYFNVDPDSAQVTSDSVFVCNPDRNGDTHLGRAYTILAYNSNSTFTTVFITARTGGANPVSETIEFVLPLQEPTIELTTVGNWYFPIDGDPCRIPTTCLVRDGHHNLINGARVDYMVQRGQFFTSCTAGTHRDWATTGPFGDPSGQPDGECFLCLRGTAASIFPDPFTVELNAEVRVEVHGYTEATDNAQILFRRGAGLNGGNGKGQ